VSHHVIREVAGARDLLALAAADPRRYPGLLESVARGNPRARYDILFAFPQRRLQLDADGEIRDGERRRIEGRFLDALDQEWSSERIAHDDSIGIPFRGGWLLFLGYELVAEIEPSLRLPDAPDASMPTAVALRCPAAIIADHQRDVGDQRFVDVHGRILRCCPGVPARRAFRSGSSPRAD
jgi:anthranilate synthase component 1